MKKKEKKEIVKKLIQEVLSTTDVDEYATKRSQLFHEILDAGYRPDRLEGTTLAIDTWCKDLDDNMKAKLANTPAPHSADFINMSAIGLLTLIDTSLLPD